MGLEGGCESKRVPLNVKTPQMVSRGLLVIEVVKNVLLDVHPFTRLVCVGCLKGACPLSKA